MKNKGFTLIELLVVIVLIAVLLIIVAPNLFGARESAKEGINKEQEKNIKDAAMLVGVDLDDYMSRIYNCKSDSWIEDKCTKDEDHKWTRVDITVEDLVEHGYFEDAKKQCKGDISITKNSSGTYSVKLVTASCGQEG